MTAVIQVEFLKAGGSCAILPALDPCAGDQSSRMFQVFDRRHRPDTGFPTETREPPQRLAFSVAPGDKSDPSPIENVIIRNQARLRFVPDT